MQERIEISSEPLNMNQGFWVAKGATATGCLNDGEIGYDNSSRIESKRSQQWFMEGHPEVELLPNKKQAVEVPNSNHLFSGMLNTSVAPWGSSGSSSSTSNPGFHSWLYESETAKAVGFDDRNISSLGSGKMNLERKINDDLFGNESSFGLSMSHALVDPGSSLTYGGLRKVKVSEVKDSENPMCVSMGQAYNRDNDSLVAMALTYNKVGDDILSVGDTYERADNHFLSADQTFSKGDNGITSMDQIYKVEESSISTGLVYSKAEESSISTSHAFNQGHSYNKGESTIISFGGYDDDANDSQRLISSYELLMGHASGQKMEEMNEKTLANSNSEVLNSHVTTAVESVSKKKDDHKIAKKTPPNNFPSNVRSLLSTGMLDGVPVKYIAWSREKELRGVIKGAGYLCGCQSCNFTKVINAYEFERHAACKTKHPNNHIYFENGKTIYGIVQELRSTPQNMLFDVIQTITGSPINQKSFRLWKESFLAATRELQRIYGSDEGKQFC